jgi:hypothetical protein
VPTEKREIRIDFDAGNIGDLDPDSMLIVEQILNADFLEVADAIGTPGAKILDLDGNRITSGRALKAIMFGFACSQDPTLGIDDIEDVRLVVSKGKAGGDATE